MEGKERGRKKEGRERGEVGENGVEEGGRKGIEGEGENVIVEENREDSLIFCFLASNRSVKDSVD